MDVTSESEVKNELKKSEDFKKCQIMEEDLWWEESQTPVSDVCYGEESSSLEMKSPLKDRSQTSGRNEKIGKKDFKENSCDLCNINFKNIGLLTNDLKSHANSKVFNCKKIKNPSYMDNGVDRKSESMEKRQRISKLCEDPISGTSSTINYSSRFLPVDVRLLQDSATFAWHAVTRAEKFYELRKKIAVCRRNRAIEMQNIVGDVGPEVHPSVRDCRLSIRYTAKFASNIADRSEKRVNDAKMAISKARNFAIKMDEICKLRYSGSSKNAMGGDTL